MSTPLCSDENMRSLLGFLVLDRLSAVERESVLEHLRSCSSCRAERDEVDGVVSLLSGLPDDVMLELAAELDPDGPGITALGGGSAADSSRAPEAGGPGAAPADRPAPTGPPNVVRLAADRPSRPSAGAGRRGRSRSLSLRRHRKEMIAVAIVGAVTGALMLRPWTSSEPPHPAVAVASVGSSAGGVSMSAELFEEEEQVRVTLTATGLGRGSYRLYAVTAGGQRLLLAQLSGASGTGVFQGAVPVRLRDLSSFDLHAAGGALTVSASLR